MRKLFIMILVGTALAFLSACAHRAPEGAPMELPIEEPAAPEAELPMGPLPAEATSPTQPMEPEELPAFFTRALEEEEAEAEAAGSTQDGVIYAPPERVNPLLGDETPVVLNFEDAPLREVLITLSKLADMDFILSPEVGGGKVTIMMSESRPLKREDLFGVIMTILELNNLAAVDAGPYFKIVPSPEAKTRPILTQIGKDPNLLIGDDTVVTQIIPIEFVQPADVLESIRPLLSADTSVIANPDTNLLIMTGLQSNLKRLLALIDMMDVDSARLELEIFQIRYADVADISSVVERIFGSQQTPARSRTPTRRSGGRRAPATPAVSAGGGSKDVLLIPDARSNSLIVFAQRRDIEFIREIIAMLDVDIYVSRKTYIYYVENAKASDMASLLSSVYQRSGDERQAAPTRAKPGEVGAGQLVGEVNIVADERTNALVIVTAPTNYPYIIEIIQKLDIMPKQVLIEMLIADVTLNDDMKFGVEWALASQGELDVGGDTYFFDGLAGQSVNIADQSLGFTYSLFEASRFRSFLQAYASANKLEVLSSPHIMVTNNQEAKIDVGSEVPVVTAETQDNTNTSNYNRTIEYRDTGILLTVTPHINENRMVNLELTQEVSNVASQTLAGIDSPVIEKRKASTTVVVKDGETLVIGGMIQKTHNPSSEGIPWLSKIPVLGWLFGRRTRSEHTSELLIFLTPHVIATPEEASTLSSEFRQRVRLDRLKDIDDFEYFRLGTGGDR